ncbi:hypothetical protein ACFQEX_18265 [Roseibium salinum]|uniref:hypothetical protein n=1 Tax=Roseibium salinum TaxID=1604349 RepID=UPI00361C926F
MDLKGTIKYIRNGKPVWDRKFIGDYYGSDRFEEEVEKKIVGESIASQLPGRQNGGAADAYRHILLAAELVRLYETDAAYRILFNHELDETGGADNGLDMWNNAIGMKIGKHVRDNKGGWEDIVRLSRAAIVGSFTEGNYDQIKNWKRRSADDGIRIAFDQDTELQSGSWFGESSFDDYASRFNRTYAFRAREGEIVLEGGKLVIPPIAVTSPQFWSTNPKVQVKGKDVELSVQQSQFPTPAWFEGQGFVYETGNAAPILSFSPKQLRIRLQPEEFPVLSFEPAWAGTSDVPLSNLQPVPGSSPILGPELTPAPQLKPSGPPAETLPEPGVVPDQNKKASFEGKAGGIVDLSAESHAPPSPLSRSQGLDPEPVEFEHRRTAAESQDPTLEFEAISERTKSEYIARRTSYDTYRRLGLTPEEEAQAVEEFRALVKESYVDMGGDMEAAQLLAARLFAFDWGLSAFAQAPEGTVLKHPVEKVYPELEDAGHDYIRGDVEAFLEAQGIKAARWYLTPNEKTGRDRKKAWMDDQGYGPRMTLAYDDDTGGQHVVTDSYQADIRGPRLKQTDAYNRALGEQAAHYGFEDPVAAARAKLSGAKQTGAMQTGRRYRCPGRSRARSRLRSRRGRR